LIRARAFSVPLLFFLQALPVRAETVVDVSNEWKAHISSSPVPTSIHPETAVQRSTGAPEAEEPACSCDSLTPQEKLDQSTYAFTGFVSEVATKKGTRTVGFDVDEIFKGSPKDEMKVTTQVTGDACDLSFEEGGSYLVFARWEWGNVVTSRCMGTKLLPKARAAELGPSEELKEKLYIHLRNACMGRIDTPCCLSSLKAMRAGYYIPEPEDGCPSGSIPDRLHCGGSYTWCIPVLEKTHGGTGY
jgi:hypothetical protein